MIKVKGSMRFYKVDGIEDIFYEYDDYKEEKEIIEYDLIDIEEFIEDVKNRNFLSGDGEIHCIIVNGYKSNLGVDIEDITKGGLKLNEDDWKYVIKNIKDIKVNWINKL